MAVDRVAGRGVSGRDPARRVLRLRGRPWPLPRQVPILPAAIVIGSIVVGALVLGALGPGGSTLAVLCIAAGSGLAWSVPGPRDDGSIASLLAEMEDDELRIGPRRVRLDAIARTERGSRPGAGYGPRSWPAGRWTIGGRARRGSPCGGTTGASTT
jgi:hypothetical protein